MNASSASLTIKPENIPAMPTVASRVMKLMGMPPEKVNLQELANVIHSDSSLASKVLKLANSSFYSPSCKIGTIRKALISLDLSAVKGLVVSVVMKNTYKNPGLEEEMMWKHSVGVAIAAKQLAQTLRCVDSDEAFTGGLMHDFGKSVIYLSEKARQGVNYQQMFTENLAGAAFIAREEAAFGLNHLAVGEQVAQKWELEDGLRCCLSHHHVPDENVIRSSANPDLLAVVAQANFTCHRLGIGICEPQAEAPIGDNPALKWLKQDQSWAEAMCEKIAETYEEQKDSFFTI